MLTKFTNKQLQRRDAARHIGEELLQSVRDMKRGHAARLHKACSPDEAKRNPG